DVLPAEFAGRTEQVLPAIGPRQQLAAEADTQRCATGIDETAHQLEQLRKPWRTFVVQRVLPTAEHDEAVIAVGRGRQRLALPGAHGVDRGPLLVEGSRNLTEAGVVEVLDGEDAHGGHDNQDSRELA